jgi:hypothetical protein
MLCTKGARPLPHLPQSHQVSVAMAALQKGAPGSTHWYWSPVGQVCVGKFPEEFSWFSHTVVVRVDFYYPWFLQYFTFALSVALFLKCMDTGLTYLGLKVDLLSLGLFWFFLYLDHCQNHHWFGHFTQ